MQTEMQATIAFACYDNDEVLKDGKGMNKKSQVAKILELYMPSVPKDEYRMCYVDQFLSGLNQFKCLFQCNSDNENKNKLTIPEELHRELGKKIYVGKDGIGRSLLTSKNLSNPQDISGETLYRHAKEVEANCKKALAVCMRSDSPWKGFDGHYPSGTTWFDYIEWIRREMYLVSNDTPTCDIIDADLDELPKDQVNDILDHSKAEKVTPTKRNKRKEKKKSADADDPSSDYDEEDAEEDAPTYEELVEDEKEIQNFVDEVLRKEDDSAVPDNEYFKGFWVFALWGYIPPPGYEEFKCTMISTVVDDGNNNNNNSNGRAEAKEK